MRLRPRRRALRRPATFEPLESRCLLSSLNLEVGSVRPLPEEEGIPVAPAVRVGDRFGTGVQLDQVRSLYGFTGRGQTIAVIDTGIAYDQQALGGGFGNQARVVGGWDAAEQDSDPYDDGPAGFHGTHVAGIIAADDDRYPGVAPGVDLVAVRVFDDVGNGTMAWVEQALRWVNQNRNSFRYPITTVNLSLGAEYNGSAPPTWATLEDEFRALRQNGILTVAAAGNSFSRYGAEGLSYPAASPYVLPVGSLDADGNLSSFSQRLDRMLAAPGENIVSTVPDHLLSRDRVNDDWVAASGTSMASPIVAGASAIVRYAMSIYDVGPTTPEGIVDLLRRNASSVADSVTGRTYRALDLAATIASLVPADDYGDTFATSENLGELSTTTTRSGLIATTNDRDLFRFQVATRGWIGVDLTTIDTAQFAWSIAGAQRVLREGNWVYQVEPGRDYVVEVSASDRAGRYELQLDWEADSAIDLGVVEQQTLQLGSPSGGLAYTFTAAQDGLLTLTTRNATAQWRVQRSDGSFVEPRQDARFGGRRLELQVRRGERYLLQSFTATPWKLEIANRLTLKRGVLRITAADNSTTVVALGTRVNVSLDGVRYSWKSEQVERIVYDGTASAADLLRIYGSRDSENVTVNDGTLSWRGSRTDVTARGVESLELISGGGVDDVIRVRGSESADRIVATPKRVKLDASRFRLQATLFDRAYIDGGGGADVARLVGSAGNDTFVSYRDGVRLFGAEYHVRVTNVESIDVHAGSGEDDVARFFGSTAAESWLGMPGKATWTGGGNRRTVRSFDRIYAYDMTGAGDTVALQRGAERSLFEVDSDRIVQRSSGFYQRVEGWRSGTITGSFENSDAVRFWDNDAVDRIWSEVGEGEWEVKFEV